MRLRYMADLRTLAFVAIYYSITIAGWVYYPQMSWPVILLTVAAASVFSFFCAVIVHNTIHSPIFRSRTVNRIFQHFLSFSYGHPVSAFVPGHNFSHHKHTQTTKDVMRTTKMRYKWNFLNQLLFFHTMGGDIISSELRFVKNMYKEKPVWFRQYLAEAIVFFGSQIVLAIIDWEKFLLFVFIPHQYAVWGIVGVNFWQHDGCDMNHRYNHSRNFTGKFLNYVAFNNGYHGMHHNRPGLHWSLLPEWHAKYIRPYLHPNLEQKSLTAYLWRTLIWPGKRLTYDLKPVELPPKVKDEDWVADVKVNADKYQLGAGI